MRKPLTVLLILTLLFTAIPLVVSANPIISSEAEEHILNELRRANIPNAAVAVIQGGETSYILKDSTHETLFQIGSVAKSFTGFGVLLLEDMGLLSVNDPVNQHLPWFEVRYDNLPVPHEDITIYNLLQHTSGFTSDERRFPSTVDEITKDEMITQLMGIELAFYPSMGHEYGNLNYVILGFIIEAVSGQSYDEFMTQYVLHPLGLYNTFTNTQLAHDTGQVIAGHRFGFLRARPHDVPWASLTMPAGGMYSSISDMARWAGIHLGVVEVSEQFARVAQRSHENNHTSENPFVNSTFFGDAFFDAAGWQVFEDGTITHGGSVFGYFADVMMLPERNIAVVVLSNLRHLNVPQWSPLILEAVYDGNFNRAGMDPFAMIDIAFIVLTAMGVFFIGLFVRLVLKLRKQLHISEKTKSKIKIKWLIGSVLSAIGLLAFYIVLPMVVETSYRIALLVFPASMTAATVAVWIALAYSLFSMWTKIFVSSK
ncbi:MAG: serine hydrolase, partial [Defluviitaleaceae bacterium]|nr:serine hydrolase [Defluviitaleaceae bacterium]